MNWIIKPSRDPDDQLFNRRLLAYYSLMFTALWSVSVLALWAFLRFYDHDVPATDLTVLFGVPGTITAITTWKYFDGAKTDQILKNQESADDTQDI